MLQAMERLNLPISPQVGASGRRIELPPSITVAKAHGVGRVVGALGFEAGFAGSMLN